jgi:multidrug efflux pump subunit AcrB
VGSFSLVTNGFVGSEFAPATDKGEVSLVISMQPGTKLSTTNEAVNQIEKKLSTIKDITKTFVNVGYTSEGFGENYSTNLATINIALVPANQRKKSLPDLSREIRAIAMEVPGVKARVTPIGLFGANDAPIQLNISGTERDKVFADAERILDTLRTITGITSPRMSVEKGKPEIDIVIDKTKAAELGINPEMIGANLRTAINGCRKNSL